ncbi:MAG: flagellar hook protein FlgE [Burkholderiales bacterium]|nr:flagellar hook protein FlgE [Burkholderiales bacterium]
MGFQQALSGLNAADQNMQVIGNNVANSNTAGFKSSTAQFADLYASSLAGGSVGGSGTQIGIGTSVSSVSENFTQGNLATTNNPLDLAINGAGFFRMNSGGTVSYTRNGQFQEDKNGFIVNSNGLNLTGYSATNGLVNTGTITNLQIPTANFPPKATSSMVVGANLSSSSTAPTVAPFNATDPNTYNFSTPQTIYDSLGQSHSSLMYFVKTATPNVWNAYTYVDGTSADPVQSAATLGTSSTSAAQTATLAAGGTAAQATTVSTAASTAAALAGATPATIAAAASTAATGAGLTAAQATSISNAIAALPAVGASMPSTLTFSTAGALVPPATNLNKSITLTNGAAPLTFTMDYTQMTQYGTTSVPNVLSQNGYTSGQLNGFGFGSDGTLTGRYTNGQSQVLGQVVLANFNNVQGLQPLGNNQFAETGQSGSPLVSVAGTASFGTIQSSAVEASNVDLTAQLVNMITAQRAYQANAQTIKTENQMMQTIVSLQ